MCGSASRLGLYGERIYLRPGLHACPRTTIAWDHLPSCVPASLAPYGGSVPVSPEGPTIPLATIVLRWARNLWYRNINRLCIDYASRPRLSSRLTLGGLAFPRNPWIFGGGVSHPSLATHTCILTRPRSTTVYTGASQQDRRSATAFTNVKTRDFGSGLEPRYIVRARSLDQ